MNPIVGIPLFSIGNNGNTLYIDAIFNGPGFGLTDAIVSFDGVNLNVETNIVNAPNSTISCELGVDISAFGNLYPVELIINDTIGVRCYDQNIGVAANLPPKIHVATGNNTDQGMEERIFLNLEMETIGILEDMLTNFSNYYQKTFKNEVPKGYSEFVQHVEKARSSLTSAIKAQNSLKSVIEE